jgi:hypothetical protein
VGAGAASVLEDGGWYYQLAEVPDMSLGCTVGQNWDLGLFRARTASSTDWEQYPGGNPVVYSSRAPDAGGSSPWCNVLYPGLFKDDATGTTYLMHGRMSPADPAHDGIYVYRLEWDRNLLHNGDFQRGDVGGWEQHPGLPTQQAVERFPDNSPDGTPYLSIRCGTPSCDAGPSIYQDVTVLPRMWGDTLAFGGTFRADAGAGRVEIAVLQLDEAGAVVASSIVPLDTGEAYARARGKLQIDPRARRLRFELYPRSPGTLRADNLYLIPQEGCARPRYPAC